MGGIVTDPSNDGDRWDPLFPEVLPPLLALPVPLATLDVLVDVVVTPFRLIEMLELSVQSVQPGTISRVLIFSPAVIISIWLLLSRCAAEAVFIARTMSGTETKTSINTRVFIDISTFMGLLQGSS